MWQIKIEWCPVVMENDVTFSPKEWRPVTEPQLDWVHYEGFEFEEFEIEDEENGIYLAQSEQLDDLAADGGGTIETATMRITLELP